MSSLEIAELTGKTHSNVLRDIRNMLEELYAIDDSKLHDYDLKGVLVSKDSRGYISRTDLDYSHTQTLITGYSITLRKKVIDRWQELENNIVKLPDFNNPVLAARAWADEAEAKQIAQAIVDDLQAKIAIDKPKVEFAEAIEGLNESMTIGDFAKLIGTGQNRLFKQLREDGYLKANNVPYQTAIDRGLLELIELAPYLDRWGMTHHTFQSRITGKGQLYFERKYRKENKIELLAMSNAANQSLELH